MASRHVQLSRPTPAAPRVRLRVPEVKAPRQAETTPERAKPFDELQLAVFASIRGAAKTRRRVQ